MSNILNIEERKLPFVTFPSGW